MSQLPTRECQYERRVSDLSDRGAKSVRSLNPQQDVPMPLKGEDILMASSIQAVDSQDVALSVRDLSVSLPGGMERAYAVENISFDLKRGQILCIIGESGSGKSVTANAIMGLLPRVIRVSSGAIHLDGMNIAGLPAEKLRGLRGRVVSMIFQDPLSALNPLMTVGAQIEEAIAAHGIGTPKSRRSRAIELLTEVGLPDVQLMYHQYPFRLSGGQRQRVMIAIALALEPAILIADEPTTALDVTTQAQILKLIRDIQRRKGMSVMFITHDFGVVAEIADSVVVMEKGHVVEQGSAVQVLQSPSHPYTRRLIAAVPHLTGKDRIPLEAAGKAPILQVEDLVKTYRSGTKWFGATRTVPAVNNVSFDLAPGRTLGVVGESGSGKSTLGRLLIKLMNSDGGRILFEGRDVAAADPNDLSRSFRLPQPTLNDRSHPHCRSGRAWNDFCASTRGGPGTTIPCGSRRWRLWPLSARVLRWATPTHRHCSGADVQTDAADCR
jgi:peptide/nickel transport system ATP-binding protein